MKAVISSLSVGFIVICTLICTTLVGCAPTPVPGRRCETPGAVEACPCADGSEGKRTCKTNKRMTPCQCQTTATPVDPAATPTTGDRTPTDPVDGEDDGTTDATHETDGSTDEPALPEARDESDGEPLPEPA